MSLRQLAETTKIPIRMLEALERNDLAQLPGRVFARGFVRSYAVEIGIDPDQTVRGFMAQFPAESVAENGPRVSADDSGAGGRGLDARALVILGALVLAGAVILYWLFHAP